MGAFFQLYLFQIDDYGCNWTINVDFKDDRFFFILIYGLFNSYSAFFWGGINLMIIFMTYVQYNY